MCCVCASRLHQAFRPRTRGAYLTMFRTFVVFCVHTRCVLLYVKIKVVLSFLECLVINDCSVSMIENYVSAIKAHFVLHDLSFTVFEHPKLKYFLKALRINRPLTVKSHNIISIDRLIDISVACEDVTSGPVYRAVLWVLSIIKPGSSLLGCIRSVQASNRGRHIFYQKICQGVAKVDQDHANQG